METEIRPNAILVGGPADVFPEGERILFIEEQCEKFRLLRGNHYEHFRRSADTVRHRLGDLKVFVWSGITYVAE